MRRLIVAALALLCLAATGRAALADVVVGVSWGDLTETRWKADEAAIADALRARGTRYIFADARGAPDKQLTDIGSLMTRGADVLIVVAEDPAAIMPAIEKATEAGVPVIAYDAPIAHREVLYVAFDTEGAGRLMAEAVRAVVRKGNYVIIKDSETDPATERMRAGMEDVIGDAVKSGDIKIVGETYADGRDRASARKAMDEFLTASNNQVDAVLAGSDDLAGGAISALVEQGLVGEVPVSGAGADPSALNRIAAGTQTVTLWNDPHRLAEAAAAAAIALADDTDVEEIEGAVGFSGPDGVRMHALLVAPVAITRDNLNVLVENGWATKRTICKGVPAGTVAVCG